MSDVEGRVVRSTEVEMIAGQGGSTDLVCPNCGDYLGVVHAPYGWYSICRRDRVRWTHINGYTNGVYAERWTPMNERDRLTGLPNEPRIWPVF